MFNKKCLLGVNNLDFLFIIYYIIYIIKRSVNKMIYPSIDKILNIVDSKYALVYVVSNRSKEMQKTKHYQMDEKDYHSVVFCNYVLNKSI